MGLEYLQAEYDAWTEEDRSGGLHEEFIATREQGTRYDGNNPKSRHGDDVIRASEKVSDTVPCFWDSMPWMS